MRSLSSLHLLACLPSAGMPSHCDWLITLEAYIKINPVINYFSSLNLITAVEKQLIQNLVTVGGLLLWRTWLCWFLEKCRKFWNCGIEKQLNSVSRTSWVVQIGSWRTIILRELWKMEAQFRKIQRGVKTTGLAVIPVMFRYSICLSSACVPRIWLKPNYNISTSFIGGGYFKTAYLCTQGLVLCLLFIGLQQKRSETEEIKMYSFERKGLLGSLVLLIKAGRVVAIVKEASINKERPLHWNRGKDNPRAPR